MHLISFIRLRQQTLQRLTIAIIILSFNHSYADLFAIEKDGVVTITTTPSRGARSLKKRRKRRKVRKVTTQNKSVQKKRKKLPSSSRPFRTYVKEAAQYYALPEALLWGIMKVVSNFNPKTVSDQGAQGLMQLMPVIAKDMGVQDAFNPEQNIYGAARLLRTLANRFNGDLVLTLSAYFAEGRTINNHSEVPYDQTAQYVKMTLNAYYQFTDKSSL